MSAATDIEATVAVLRALRRREPVTYATLALVTELDDRRVRRIVAKLEGARCPIVRGETGPAPGGNAASHRRGAQRLAGLIRANVRSPAANRSR
ncbi:MAG: hypothetical protein ABIR65_01235 [Pseudolysinimonas sp.]